MAEYITVTEGVEQFPENQHAISQLGRVLTVSELFERDSQHPKYHGDKRPGCCLVKKRIERTNPKNKDHPHYLSIWTCLHCPGEVECLKSGWEVGWYGGTESAKLK